MNRIFRIFIAVLVFLTFTLESRAQLYTFQNFNHKDGLNIASVLTSYQSPDGYLWLGTSGLGLIRFNGNEFKEINFGGNLEAHHINQIIEVDSKLLFPSKYNGFFSYNPKNNELESLLKEKIKYGESEAICVEDSIYYFIGSKAIFSGINHEYSVLLKNEEGTERIEVTQVIQTKDGHFVLTNNGGYHLSKGKIEPLNDWLGIHLRDLNSFKFGYFDDGILFLLNDKGDRSIEITLDNSGGYLKIKENKVPRKIDDDDLLISYSYNQSTRSASAVTLNGRLFLYDGLSSRNIVHNFNEEILSPQHIFTDINEDFWVSSNIKGLYKVSQEAFTKVAMHSIYESSNLGLIYRTVSNDIILSDFEKGTYITNLFKPESDFQNLNFQTLCIDEIGDIAYLGTNDGLKSINPVTGEVKNLLFDRNKVTFTKADGENLWVFVVDSGLYLLNTKNLNLEKIESESLKIEKYYCYTGQISEDKKFLYIGSNDGLLIIDRKSKKLSRAKNNKIGSYIGISTKDNFGNIWFSGNTGILAIKKDHSKKVYKDQKYFNSKLFFTLIADDNDNIIIGTNKGLTFLKVNHKADIIDVNHYDRLNGFSGFETNMRAQFKKGKSIFLGTIEGLYLVNSDLLAGNRKIIAPVIHRRFENFSTLNSQNSLLFEFSVNHAKAGAITYVYKIKELHQEWFQLGEEENFIEISGLKNGEYTLQVKASYDGEHFSKISERIFHVNIPIWKTNWFIILMMLIIIVANILLLKYYNVFERGKLIHTKDLEVHLKLTPTILLFASIAAPLSQILAPLAVPELSFKLGQSLIMAFILLSLYLLSLNAKSSNTRHLYDRYLKIAFIVVLTNFMWEVFDSRLHPFNIIGVVLISSVTPYILSKIKNTIIFSIIILAVSIAYTAVLDSTVYPKFYFIVAMIVMVSLTILSSYLRYDSLEKLIFVSTIINKGNIPAIAFNREGKVIYASENISNFVDIEHEELIGNNISILNNFIPYGDNYIDKDITKEFKDGELYLVPLINKESKMHWVEWSYKEFSPNVKVVLGQDVSEKLELENTYELLVQNAEDFIYRVDIDGNFVFLNDICYSKMGYEKSELVGTFSLDIVLDDFKVQVGAFYREHFENRLANSYFEFPILKKSGEMVWVGQYVTTIYATGSSNYITGFIALARDITEIKEQQQLIENQQDSITSSINYARRIQFNMLPREEDFEECFLDYFIFSKPKDIVSGDFFWMHRIKSTTILILADCTGHGVPGSFMTLLGINMLNTIILENNVLTPSEILNDLDKKLMEYLPRGKGKNAVNDGMEVTVCAFDEETNSMSYACAGSRFLIHEQSAFTMFKGDNKHIGDIEQGFNGYSTHYANLTNDYSLFLFTDGFQDQFGGIKDKKYSFRRMLELFESNINLPLKEQKKMIESDFEQWVGNSQQTDDVTIISVKRKII